MDVLQVRGTALRICCVDFLITQKAWVLRAFHGKVGEKWCTAVPLPTRMVQPRMALLQLQAAGRTLSVQPHLYSASSA